jgi:DNA polymerase-3 subunit beta
MNGIHIELRQDSMVLASSDFNRLSKFICCEVTSSEDKTSAFNVPRKSASILLSLLNRYEGKVKITDASGVVIFNNTEFMLTTRLIEGRYPNFESVIPKNSCTEAIVSRDSMIRTLKRMSMLMAGYNLMTVSVNGGDNGTIMIASDDSINGKMSEESVSADITGDSLSIGFNIKSFLECIQEVGTENVIIRFTSPTTPATVQPMNDDTYLYVLMPLLVS